MLYRDGTQWKKGAMSRCCRSIQTAPTMALTSDFRDEPKTVGPRSYDTRKEEPD